MNHSNPTDSNNEELKQKLGFAIAHGTYMDDEAREAKFNEIWQDIVARDQQIALAAQQNGVAWAIGIIDEMHVNELFDKQISEGSLGDKGYKGVKNTLRDRYKAETGIDPAPNYPVNATLKAAQEKS